MIGIRCNRTAIQIKRLSSVMGRVADSHPGEQGSKPGPSNFFYLMDPLYGSIIPPIYCIVSDKECMAEYL